MNDVGALAQQKNADRLQHRVGSGRTPGVSAPEIMDIYGEGFDAVEAEFLSGAPRCMFQVDICDV
jgi:hypothetical protein